ncbi:MAG: FGGY-family carbohydrate kinase, partial [Oscillospiraceae bacterium]
GCDAGTSGTKAVITDKSGKIIAQAHRGYSIITPHSGWAEQWPDVWLDAVSETIKEVAAAVDSSKIAAICISALYGGTGALCDEKMSAVRPAIIWMDRRAEEETRWARENISEDKLFEISKNGADSYFGYIKLLWVKNHEPEIWSKVKNILPVHSYIVYKLTGEITADYCSVGNIGGIYDYNNHAWSEEITRLLGIDISLLPKKLMKPTDIAGGLNREYAHRLGVPENTPICVGTVDCVASMLSASMKGDGDNAAVLGTSLNWGFIQKKLPDDKSLISMPYCTEPTKLSYTYGGASTAGALPRWFMTNFMHEETAEAYKALEDEIVKRNIPAGSDGLIVLPYFMGERSPIWDENASGLIIGLSLMHTKEHIFKAVLESTAYSLRHIMESANKENADKIILVGGGSKSALWKQIFADVTGVPVYTPVKTAEAPLGDAFMAGISCGLVSDFNEIDKWVEFNEPVLPDDKKHALYNEYYLIYKGLYPSLKNDMARLKQISFNF